MNTTNSKQTKRLPAPRRLFIQEVTPETNYVRIMATLMAIHPQELQLDDGSSILTVKNTLAIKGTVGQTVDVVLYRTSASTPFYTQEIVWNVSPQDETLRTMQLTSSEPLHLGYICPQVSSQDILRAVNHGGGVTIQELALVYDITPQYAEECLQELQLQGEIYMNRDDKYVPI